MSKSGKVEKIQSIRGMNDLVGREASRWGAWEQTIRRVLKSFHYQEIRTPVLEKTELFVRGVGGESDIVHKEMYTFLDRSEESLTLRPEGTAPVVRALIQHHFHLESGGNRVFYFGPMFRYERPQKGRTRQFTQFGIEFFDDPTPMADAETLILVQTVFNELGVMDYTIHLNSIGDAESRELYTKELKNYLNKHQGDLDEDSRRRIETNPLRVWDSKIESTQEILTGAPKISDFLNKESREHESRLQSLLKAAGVSFEMNPKLVRGLDYYSKTVYEIQGNSPALGSQNALGGGGRYDDLVALLGGKPTPAVGFASSFERLSLAIPDRDEKRRSGAYVAFVGEETSLQDEAIRILGLLWGLGVRATADYTKKSFKSHLKSADRTSSRYALIIGGDELAKKEIQIKDLESGEQVPCPLSSSLRELEEWVQKSDLS